MIAKEPGSQAGNLASEEGDEKPLQFSIFDFRFTISKTEDRLFVNRPGRGPPAWSESAATGGEPARAKPGADRLYLMGGQKDGVVL